MWIVDTDSSRGRTEQAHPGGHHRRRLHVPGPDQPDHAQHPGYARWWRSRTVGWGEPSTCSATPGFEDVVIAGPSGNSTMRSSARSRSSTEDAMLIARSRAYRRAGRCHRIGGVRRPRGAGGVQARQGRRADECRARRHDRADPADICRQARRDSLRLRGRRAGHADEPLPLGQGTRPHAALARQHQGSAGSATATRRRRRGSPSDGDRIRRW